MKVKRNFIERKKVIDLLRGDRFPVKTFSVTRLTCCPRKTYWRMSGIEQEYSDSTILTFTRGTGIHKELEVYDVKETQTMLNGVRGDIDMIGERVTEIYTTTLGLKRNSNVEDILSKFSMKVMQLTAYCYMLEKTEGDLMVFYMMGDYTRPIKPELEIYTITYSPIETELIWKALLEKKKVIEDALKNDIPPLEKGEDFECTNCLYDYLCLEFEKYVVTL